MRFTFEIYIVVHCVSKRKGIFCKKKWQTEKESANEQERKKNKRRDRVVRNFGTKEA